MKKIQADEIKNEQGIIIGGTYGVLFSEDVENPENNKPYSRTLYQEEVVSRNLYEQSDGDEGKSVADIFVAIETEAAQTYSQGETTIESVLDQAEL